MNKLMSKSLLAATLLFSATGFAATITVVPSTATPTVGSTFTVDLFGAGFPDVVGATLKLTFNPNVSVVSPAVSAGFSTAGGQFTGGVAIPPTCTPSYAGTLACNFSILGPLVGTLPTGNFGGVRAVRITFNALALGAANIVVVDDGGDFSFTDANTFGAVPTTYTQAAVTVVSAVPVPAAAWLFGSALGLIGVARRRIAAV